MRGHLAEVDPNDLLLTTSTSEAYSFLFRLLCDAGDSVLVAQPSYPLFDFLAGLDEVRLGDVPDVLRLWMAYRFRGTGAESWIGDQGGCAGSSEQSDGACYRGNGVRDSWRRFVSDMGLALIVDEVFLDYGLERRVETVARGRRTCATFVVSGLSKVAALPQMKVGWILCLGPEKN